MIRNKFSILERTLNNLKLIRPPIVSPKQIIINHQPKLLNPLINNYSIKQRLFPRLSYSFCNSSQRYIKSKLKAYQNLCGWHLPIGAMLLYWPTAWGVCIGSAGLPSIFLLSMFLMGSWTSRSAGCIVNDYFDR